MRFLAAESVEAGIVGLLREEGHDVLYISDTAPGVRENRGAGAGCVTPPTSTWASRASACGCRAASANASAASAGRPARSRTSPSRPCAAWARGERASARRSGGSASSTAPGAPVLNHEWLSDVVTFFGDARRAALLYDLLLPYADRCATPSIASCRGSISRSLGILATPLARYDEAERHFENALEMNARIRARIWVAHTQHDYARMLVARNRPGDRERATALAAQASRRRARSG